MKPLLIGSAALKHHVSDAREPADLDIMVSVDGLKLFTDLPHAGYRLRTTVYGRFVDFFVTDRQSAYRTDLLCHQYGLECGGGTERFAGVDLTVAPMDLLWALKRSSIPTGKAKHQQDLDRYFTGVVPDRSIELLADLRLRETGIRIKAAQEIFFGNDGVRRVVPHDVIHHAVADPPAFKLVVDDVNPSHADFLLLGLSGKCQIVAEEATVLAIERGCLAARTPLERSIQFAQLKNSFDPIMFWVRRIAENKLARSPVWLAEFTAKNINEVAKVAAKLHNSLRHNVRLTKLISGAPFWVNTR